MNTLEKFNNNDLLQDNNISTNVPPLPSVEDFKGQIDESSNVPPLGVGETLQVDDENMTDDDILNLWESLRITTQTTNHHSDGCATT